MFLYSYIKSSNIYFSWMLNVQTSPIMRKCHIQCIGWWHFKCRNLLQQCFFMQNFFLYYGSYWHLFLFPAVESTFQTVVSYGENKLLGSKNPENSLFQKSHPKKKSTFFVLFYFFCKMIFIFYSCLVLKFKVYKFQNWSKGHKIINLAAKVLILKRL